MLIISRKFVSKQAFLVHLLTELKSGRQQVARERVGSQEQFDQVCDALQYILREMRNIPRKSRRQSSNSKAPYCF